MWGVRRGEIGRREVYIYLFENNTQYIDLYSGQEILVCRLSFVLAQVFRR